MTADSTRTLILVAPLSGVVVPIESIPDPVFAGKTVGDGVSIDPLDDHLLAPCDGEVSMIHSAGHALTILTDSGVEVLIHIGLDTIDLKGKGFTPRVAKGDRVKAGAELIAFDADFVATHAKSLLTQIVITTADRVTRYAPATGTVAAGRDTVLELTLADGAAGAAPAVGATVTSPPVRVPNATGLHARPAAVLASAAKRFASDVHIRKGDETANAKSVVAVMALDVELDDTIQLVATGPDAEAAIAELVPLLESGLGDEAAPPELAPPAPAPVAAPARRATGDANLLAGVSASPGLAVGAVVQVRRDEIHVEEAASDPHRERRELDAALEKAKGQIDALAARLVATADAGKAAIFGAHRELLDDPDLLGLAGATIDAGKSAGYAFRHAVETHASRLEGLQNELLAQRAGDLRDVGRRVLECLSGVEHEPRAMPENAILVAEDLSPSETATLDRSRVLGFCTTLGGSTSHVAILARSLGIPAVAGIDPRALDVDEGTPVVLDGTAGTLRVNPPAEEMERVHRRQAAQEEKRRADLERALEPAITPDGRRIEVVANIGGTADAAELLRLGGEGVGLLRSEFLFMERSTAPTEDEQAGAYSAVARALGADRPLIIRTLDVGGDKPLAYLPIPAEANPFLGERGIRVGLDRPELLRTQLRAILRASAEGSVRVMFPMIATLGEVREAKAILEEERVRLGVAPIPVGIMVEVPAAAIMAEQFAREVDFFSIGTNDLTQYTLAMDRGHPKLAPKIDGLDPAVLRLIAMTADAAHAAGKWVGVCGGIASDLAAVPLLLGLGVDELSVSVPAIPAVKARVRELELERCRELARRALDLETAEDVRALVAGASGEEAGR